MGIFRDAGKIYKPAPEVDLGADSDEFYIHPNVKGTCSAPPPIAASLSLLLVKLIIVFSCSAAGGRASRQDLCVDSGIVDCWSHCNLHAEEGQSRPKGISSPNLSYFQNALRV